MTGKFYAKIWKEEPCQFLWEEKYMDAIDYKILKILQKNARETASNISKEIHLSVSAVIERIRKMEETGVIKEYTIIVDEKKTGNEMTAADGSQPGSIRSSLTVLQMRSRNWSTSYPAIIRPEILI